MDPATVLALGSLAGSLFGGNDEEAAPDMSSTQRGYNALPQQGKGAWDNFFNMLNDLASRSGNFPELNQTQQNAIGQYANPNYSMEGLAPYANPFQQMIQKHAEDAINRGYETDRSWLMDRSSQLGSQVKPNTNSALNTQLGQLMESKNRNLGNSAANLGYQGYKEALGLRSDTLAQMLQAGNLQQEAPYRKAGLYGNLASLIPQSETTSHTGAVEARPGIFKTIGNAVGGLGGIGGIPETQMKDAQGNILPNAGKFANNTLGNYLNNFNTNFNGLIGG